MEYKTHFEKKLIASYDGIACQYYRVTIRHVDGSVHFYYSEYFTDIIVLANRFFNNPIDKVVDFHVELLTLD